jgi:epoxyqueuosine reductase QueG
MEAFTLSLKEAIKEIAARNGWICSAWPVSTGLPSRRRSAPRDILPGCKSVIVVGVRLLDGIVQANFRAFEDGRQDLKGLYGTYGYAFLPNFELTYACYAIAQYIERETGAIATPCSTGPMTNGAQLSTRHAAVAAGLGEFGWMSIVLTPEFGPRNRFGVILTQLELEPDPLYSGKKLCEPEKCGICVRVCPTRALSEVGSDDIHRCTMDGRAIEYGKCNWEKCRIALMALKKETGGKQDYIDTWDPTPRDIEDALGRMPVNEGGLQHHTSHNCGKCLSYCPVGNWGAKFKKTGVSKGAGL